MISLCCPTRGRPERFTLMLESAKAHASGPVEVCAWRDDDDESVYPTDPLVTYGVGPRPYLDGVLRTSGLWTKAAEMAIGDIVMMAADDLLFETPGWDGRVEAAFARVPDRIVMVYAEDATGRHRPEQPFISRAWLRAAGSFAPTTDMASTWFADDWIWSIAAELRRVVYLDDVRIRHLQPRSDPTYRDGKRARAATGGLNGMRAHFYGPDVTARRDEQTRRLRAVMTSELALVPDPVPEWFLESIELSRQARKVHV